MPIYERSTDSYDDLTAEWRDGMVVVHAWDTYPESSVLAGQPRKRFLAHFDSMEAAQAVYPDARPSHPLTQPTVSLGHLPGPADPVPGGALPDDWE